MSCPVAFHYRAAESAAQASSGAVRYDLWPDPARSRWYADATWRLPARPVLSVEELRQHPTLGVDLNADHLAGWILDPCGNPLGSPVTIPLDLNGQPTSTRDGRLRAAVATLIRLAKAHGPGVPQAHQGMGKGELPARPGTKSRAVRNPSLQEASGQRSPPCKTRAAEWSRLGDQVAQDRSGPPGQDALLLTSQDR